MSSTPLDPWDGRVADATTRAQRAAADLKKLVRVHNYDYAADGSSWGAYPLIRNACGPVGDQTLLMLITYPNHPPREYQVVVRSPSFDENFMPIWDPNKPFTIRLDSECLAARFGSTKCDCREQLEASLKELEQVEQGIVVHSTHDSGMGRGAKAHLATLTLRQELENVGIAISYPEAAGLLGNVKSWT